MTLPAERNILSRMVQPTKPRARQKLAYINFRLAKTTKEALVDLAEKDHRSLNQYLVLHLEQFVASFASGVEEAKVRLARPDSGSEPPARIKQQAAAHVKTAVPVDKLAEIAESEEGWEGSDPRRLLAGTKG